MNQLQRLGMREKQRYGPIALQAFAGATLAQGGSDTTYRTDIAVGIVAVEHLVEQVILQEDPEFLGC